MHFISAIWFDKIGIVVGEDEHTKERKALIGLGEGNDEGLDVGIVMRHGKKLAQHDLENILEQIKK